MSDEVTERADAFAVANLFIELGIRDNMPVNQTKLQKLLYYAQGYWMAIYNEPLFQKHFHKWAYGPVCVQVYKAMRSQGTGPIYQKSPKGFDKHLSMEVRNFIEIIWDTFKEFSAGKLSNMSHTEAPWVETILHERIEPELMLSYFRSLQNTAEPAAATR